MLHSGGRVKSAPELPAAAAREARGGPGSPAKHSGHELSWRWARWKGRALVVALAKREERPGAHSLAAFAQQWVRLVDPPDQLGPLASESGLLERAGAFRERIGEGGSQAGESDHGG